MITWELARQRVAVAGRVIDAQTARAVVGAQVMITAAPAAFTALGQPGRTRTVGDGHFHFLDLPDGQYTLTASLPGSGSRYGTAQQNASVSRDAGGNVIMAAADIALPPTALKGQITGQNATPVVLAEVRVKGSGERTFSDSQGRYLLAGLELGDRTVLVTAQGYQPVSQTALFSQAGAEQTLNFTLVPSTA